MNMDWINITLFALNIVFLGLMIFYTNYCKKLADIAAAKDEAFEKEKGKIEATKEAVDNVLKELEKMKASVSLEEQRKHEFINERNKKLMNILRYSEQVNLSKQILLTAINNESVESLKQLQSSLNEAILNLRSDLMYMVVFNENLDKNNNATEFGDKIYNLAIEVIVRITNAISLIETMNKQMDYAINLPDGTDKLQWMQNAVATKKQLISMKDDSNFAGNTDYKEAEIKYLSFMSKLYKSDVFLKYNTEINNPSSQNVIS